MRALLPTLALVAWACALRSTPPSPRTAHAHAHATLSDEERLRAHVSSLRLHSAYAISRKELSQLSALGALRARYANISDRSCYTRFAPDFELVLFCEDR